MSRQHLLLLLFLWQLSQLDGYRCKTVSRPHLRGLTTRRFSSAKSIQDGQTIKNKLVGLINESMQKIREYIPQDVLSYCLDDLQRATSLLVLATIRRTADEYSSSRIILEWMLRSADSNNDGQLSFNEWFLWLASGGNSRTVNNIMSSEEFCLHPTLDGNVDPMIIALSMVLSYALNSMKLVTRSTIDPVTITAAYVAGGISAGILDDNVCRSLLDRLSPKTRELVLLAITLEKYNIDQTASDIYQYIQKSSQQLGNNPRLTASRILPQTRNKAFTKRPFFNLGSTTTKETNTISDTQRDIIIAVELSPNEPMKLTENSVASRKSLRTTSNILFEDDIDDSINPHATESDLRIDEEKISNEVENNLSSNSLQLTLQNQLTSLSPIHSKENILSTSNSNSDEEENHFSKLLSEMEAIGREAESTQQRLQDLDDDHAAQMRSLLLEKSSRFSLTALHEKRSEEEIHASKKMVLAISMALRATRLQQLTQHERFIEEERQRLLWRPTHQIEQQHYQQQRHLLTAITPKHLRHQIALQTMQVFAPLSHQLGLTGVSTELEVFSFVQLFPQSFASFLSHYQRFLPTANTVLHALRQEIEEILLEDTCLNKLLQKITIQTRVKSSVSAFKKMLRGRKHREEMFDMIGMRIILVYRQITPSESPQDRSPLQVSQERWPAEDEENLLNHDSLQSDRESKEDVRALYRVREILNSQLTHWKEDTARFKDYVKAPKSSGYQSLHTSLQHLASGMAVEVQIRSERMHAVAEYGSAAHSQYKALLLPPN